MTRMSRRRLTLLVLAPTAVLAVAVTLLALPGAHSAYAGLFHNGTAFPSVQMEVDCDTSTVGVQNSCSILTTSAAAIPIDVIMSNFSGTNEQVDSFGYELYNDQCKTGCVNGDTVNAAGGIGPSVPVQDPVNFPANYGCNSPPASADLGSSAVGAGASTSFLGCVLNSGTAAALPIGGSLRISGESFSDGVTAATTIVLTLSNVSAADDNTVTTISCDPDQPPPASPEGNVTGPCFPATLNFTAPPPTATATNTPTATNTATPTNTPTITPTPSIPDTDGDGLNDQEEALIGTNPFIADTDGDGLSDGYEVHTSHTDPLKPDTDGDGLTDGTEVNTTLTNPNVADSDGDGLSDGYEVNISHSNPNNNDSDGDGLHDGAEVLNFHTNPNNPDTDGDGLNDLQEVVIGTNPNNPDTDGDGLTDGQEVLTYGTSPFLQDTDGDTLSDFTEVNTTHTNPNVADTDHDGLSDGYEVNNSTTNPNNPDTDGDGLSDGAEVNTYHSNPHLVDTDGDSMPDGFEVLNFCLNVLVNDATADPDLDFVGNVAELAQGTLPCNPDTDGDGFRDKKATSHAHINTDPAVDNCILISNPSQLNTDGDFVDLPPSIPFDDLTQPKSDALGDPCDPDADNDGILNGVETAGPPCASASAATDPLKNDTDGDAATDGAECYLGTNPASASSTPLYAPPADSDHDGLSDLVEIALGTNPSVPDTDGDGILDGVEFKYYDSSPLVVDSDGDGCPDGKEIASLNEDRKVNSTDQLLIAQHFSTYIGSPTYIRALDVNKDGKVNSTDQSIVSHLFGSC